MFLSMLELVRSKVPTHLDVGLEELKWSGGRLQKYGCLCRSWKWFGAGFQKIRMSVLKLEIVWRKVSKNVDVGLEP